MKSSYHMELEGLSRALKFLTKQSLEVGTLITDKHKQVRKFLRQQHPHKDHRYDVWHVYKGVAGTRNAYLQLNNKHLHLHVSKRKA